MKKPSSLFASFNPWLRSRAAAERGSAKTLQLARPPAAPRLRPRRAGVWRLVLASALVAGLPVASTWGQSKAPRLEVTPAGPELLQFAWPHPSPGFVLQSSPRLVPPQWRDVEAGVTVQKEQKLAVVPTYGAEQYYRLRSGYLDFSDYPPSRYPNPLLQDDLRFTVYDSTGKPQPAATILALGNSIGLDAGFVLLVDLGSPCLQVAARLHSFAGVPVTVEAFNAAGQSVGSGATAAGSGTPETVTVDGGGDGIVQVVIQAPQDETLLLGLCCRYDVEAAGDPYNPFGAPVDPILVVHAIDMDKRGEPANYRSSLLPADSVSRVPFGPEDKPDVFEPKTPEKISPVLLEWIAKQDPGLIVDIIVTFQEDLRVPLLPDLRPGEDRERGKTRREAVIDNLRRARLESQEKLLAGLRQFGDGSVFEPRESFWLVNAVSLRTQLGAIRRMAMFPPAVYFQPVEGGEPPPADGNNDNDLIDGRALVVSDPYFNLGLSQPWIGLLDTGVRDTHLVFNNPRHIAWLRDCVNGGPNCDATANPGYNPGDFAWNHGTCSASILTGNDRLGAAWRGATDVRLDSWQIYTAAGLNTTAAVRAFQAAVAAFDKVLVGEIQAAESETGAIATAADNAYNAGAIVVAANGNFGPNDATVRSPGIAHKVIGVGGFMTDGGAQYDNQGRGPASDGRYKPDIQAPTWSETASASSDTAMKVFTGTSGATPYASAVAMLARNWLNRFGTYDNGQTYAFMILYGQQPWPYDNTAGAGRLRMAVNGHAWWGKVAVLNGQTIDIPIGVGTGKQNFDAALWWPESAAQAHNDIDLSLLDPSGAVRARGFSAVSVFERARVAGSLSAGTWKIRIRGYSVPTLAQVVYWAAHVQN